MQGSPYSPNLGDTAGALESYRKAQALLEQTFGKEYEAFRAAVPSQADLPGMVEEKDKLLAGEEPVCALSREPIDLANPTKRSAFLDRVVRSATKVLIITEGLLGYLDSEVVRSIGQDLLGRPAVRWWLLDVASPAILKMMQRGMGENLANAPLKFAPADGVAFFETLGWKACDIHEIFQEAVRFPRVPLFFRVFALLPQPDPRKPGKARWSAVVRFER